MYLRGVAFDPVLFPLPGLQLALDVNLRALANVLPGDFRHLVKQHHAVPFGLFNLLPGLLVGPLFAGGQAQIDYRLPAGGVPQLRVLPACANQNRFIYAACHGVSPRYLGLPLSAAGDTTCSVANCSKPTR